MRPLIYSVLAAFMLMSVLFAEPPKQAFVPACDTRELEQRITAILKENHVPGACAVTLGGAEKLWQAGLGKADLASGREVTPDTLSRVGSISKIFVSLAALKLVEDGRLQLDAPVHKLLPDLAFSNPWEGTDPNRCTASIAPGWAQRVEPRVSVRLAFIRK